MIEMSFYNGTLDKKKAEEFIKNTDKPIVYTYGFEYRNPTTHRKPISKEKAIQILNEEWCDLTEEENDVHLNAFSANDMF